MAIVFPNGRIPAVNGGSVMTRFCNYFSRIIACDLLRGIAFCAFIAICFQQSARGQSIPGLSFLKPVLTTQEKQSDRVKIVCIHPVYRFESADNLVIKPFEIVPKRIHQRELFQSFELPHIVGEHSIDLDGKLHFGKFGTVEIAGLTIDESQQAIQAQLSHFLENPEIEVEYKHKQSSTYYLILSGPGFKDKVKKRVIAPGETVLDVLATIEESPKLASSIMWICRLSDSDGKHRKILMIDYEGIRTGTETGTNYEILPGDRLYIAGQQSTISRLLTKVNRPFLKTLQFLGYSYNTPH